MRIEAWPMNVTFIGRAPLQSFGTSLHCAHAQTEPGSYGLPEGGRGLATFHGVAHERVEHEEGPDRGAVVACARVVLGHEVLEVAGVEPGGVGKPLAEE